MRLNFASVRFVRTLLLLLSVVYPGTAMVEVPELPQPISRVELPTKPPNERWIWIGDFQHGNYSRSILFNADSGEMLGQIDTGWEGVKLELRSGSNQIYNHAMFMSRGYRGERTDVVTTYDAATLDVVDELVVPAKAARGWPDPNHTALTDDGRFMLIQYLTPASSVGVADLVRGEYVGEIETAGCHHVMPAGPRSFFMVCGDGRALAVWLTDGGLEAKRKRYDLFDASRDPLHGSCARSGDTWYCVSHLGMVHSIHVGGTELVPGEPWPAFREMETGRWIPGATMQSVAVHEESGALYLAMHLSELESKGGGTDYHRQLGSEIWAFDLDTQERTKTIPLEGGASAIAVGPGPEPLIYVGDILAGLVTVIEESSGSQVQLIPIPGMPTLLQPVE